MDQTKWDSYIRKNNMPVFAIDYKDKAVDLEMFNQYIKVEGKKILDIGCEHGVFMTILNKNFNCDVTGIQLGGFDESIESLSKLGISLLAETRKKIIDADMHELPFDNNTFDIVFIMHTLEHSIAPFIVLSEIQRVLKEEGVVVIISPEEGDVWTCVPDHYSVFTFRQIANLFNKLNFIPFINYRKEYVVNIFESKRDMVCIWQKKSNISKSVVNEYSEYYTPAKSNTVFIDPKLKITYIVFHKFIDDGHTNHFIGRTDSLSV